LPPSRGGRVAASPHIAKAHSVEVYFDSIALRQRCCLPPHGRVSLLIAGAAAAAVPRRPPRRLRRQRARRPQLRRLPLRRRRPRSRLRRRPRRRRRQQARSPFNESTARRLRRAVRTGKTSCVRSSRGRPPGFGSTSRTIVQDDVEPSSHDGKLRRDGRFPSRPPRGGDANGARPH
jgi:hypothetical protein